jgi:hypothetical protein
MSHPTPPGWYPHPQGGSVAWWDGTAFAAPAHGQPAPPPPPGGWYPSDRPGLERWWDGFRWTDQVRPATLPGARGPAVGGSSRPTVRVRFERIRWAGVPWGGGTGGSALNAAVGALLAVLALVCLIFALVAYERWHAMLMPFVMIMVAIMVMLALLLLVGSAILFVNAHFCRVLERRSEATGSAAPSRWLRL